MVSILGGAQDLRNSRFTVFRVVGRTKRKSPVNQADDVSEGTRIDWACDVQNVYQRIVANLIDGDPAAMQHSIDRLTRELPAPANAAESLLLRRSAAMFLDRAGQFAHQRFHISFAQGTCRSAPPLVSEATWMDAHRPFPTLLEGWHGSYTEWFNTNHTLPAALRAARLIEQRFDEPWTTARLARAVGCSRTTLSEQFDRYFGLTPSEYLVRVRMRQGMIRLRTSNDSIEDVERSVGYQSNKFYSRVQQFTNLTPSQVRALSDEQFQSRIEERIPVRAPAPRSRRETMN